MKYQIQAIKNVLIFLLINMILIFKCNFVLATETDITIEDEPTENQFLELRAISVTEVEGQNKQVLMELWGNNVEFKGFDVRFAYDSTKLNPSNIETNEITSDKNLYFKFEQEFADSLNMFTIPINSSETGIRAIVSFKPPVTESEHIIEKEGIGKVVNTNGSVLLGKMSFQMTADIFHTSFFHLIEDKESSPLTGIKINLDGTNYFQNQSTFRFTDKTASKNAYLTNLILSTGENNELDSDNSTYKEYNLNPIFDKDILNYEIELFEYIDIMNITTIQEDLKSTMKIEIPKRDENGDLIYESDGITIVYEEKEIINNIPFEFKLNELGKPDTKVKVIVTAEDGVNKNEYQLIIKRPYGKIRGSIRTEYTDSTTGNYNCNVYAYNQDEVSTIINWDERMDAFNSGIGTDTINADLHTLTEICKVSTKDDGTFEMYVIPGVYDILEDKPGYLDHIYIYLTVNDGDEIDLGNYDLIAGDSNKDGMVQIRDKVLVGNYNGKNTFDTDYDEAYDFNNDGEIQLRDKVIVTEENGQIREIVDYR